MNKQQMVLVTAVEMFFEGADESMLQNMSAVWRGQGSYNAQTCSVIFTMSKLIYKHIKDLPAVIDMANGTGQIHAEYEGCTYKHAQVYMHLEHEYTEAMANGQECEAIVFVVAQQAHD